MGKITWICIFHIKDMIKEIILPNLAHTMHDKKMTKYFTISNDSVFRQRRLWYDYAYAIALDKVRFSTQKYLYFFLFLNKNICCGYSLEAPQCGTSNEYPLHMFSSELRKPFTWYSLLSRPMYTPSDWACIARMAQKLFFLCLAHLYCWQIRLKYK